MALARPRAATWATSSACSCAGYIRARRCTIGMRRCTSSSRAWTSPARKRRSSRSSMRSSALNGERVVAGVVANGQASVESGKHCGQDVARTLGRRPAAGGGGDVFLLVRGLTWCVAAETAQPHVCALVYPDAGRAFTVLGSSDAPGRSADAGQLGEDAVGADAQEAGVRGVGVRV